MMNCKILCMTLCLFLSTSMIIAKEVERNFQNPQDPLGTFVSGYGKSHCGIDWQSGFQSNIMATNFGKK